MSPDPLAVLPHAVAAAREAGDLVAAEFARPDGPRFSDHITAPLDHEIEMMLRDRLLALVPARFVGEEAGVLEAPANGFCWVVDPHDGTRAFLEGKRGSAVSIALLHMGIPVLAVVYAPTCPDRGPDMISWCRGGRIERNGREVSIDLRARDLAADDVVFLNHGAWQRPVSHGLACAPAGFMPLPSIAYRLARIAVGDGIATLTLRPVNALDIAAGHALLMAAGGVLVTEDGEEVTYNEQGESRPSACFGGPSKVVEVLRARKWRGSQEPRREARVTLDWPRTVPEAVLDRAAGCLFGLAIGGDLGPDTELGFVVARALLGQTRFDPAVVAAAVEAWVRTGGAVETASALARAVAIGLWAPSPLAARDAARIDRPGDSLHADIAATIAAHLRAPLGGPPGEVMEEVPGEVMGEVMGEVTGLATGGGTPHPAMAFLASEACPKSVRAAVSGAAGGRGMFSVPQTMRVLTWRPEQGLGTARPRPEICWTDDLADLAEALARGALCGR